MYKDIKQEDLEEALMKYFNSDKEFPGMKNHKWIDEDGQKYSSWEFKAGNNTIHTGDGGAELMLKAFRDQTPPKVYLENEVKNLFSKLFQEVKHGDQEHQDWLENKIKDFVKRNL